MENNAFFRYRVWDKNQGKFRDDVILNRHGILCDYKGYPLKEDYNFSLELSHSLADINGKIIFVGDILRFEDSNGIWEAPVICSRGTLTIDVCNPKQIKNPDGWDKPYERVKSRNWSCRWNYPEEGTAFVSPKPLSDLTVFRGENYKDSEQYKFHEKHGYNLDMVYAEIVGNIHGVEYND